jgi:hypothetical protein
VPPRVSRPCWVWAAKSSGIGWPSAMIIVPAVGYDLWFLPESLDFRDSTSTGFVAAQPDGPGSEVTARDIFLSVVQVCDRNVARRLYGSRPSDSMKQTGLLYVLKERGRPHVTPCTRGPRHQRPPVAPRRRHCPRGELSRCDPVAGGRAVLL